MKSDFELKGQFNIGRQWRGVVSRRTVRIIRGVRISEGQIIWATYTVVIPSDKLRFTEMKLNKNEIEKKLGHFKVWKD